MLDASNACAANGRLNEALDGFTARELAALLKDWEFTARRDQWPPDLTTAGAPWRVWLILGGRGAGKTRAGAEWVKGLALGRPEFSTRPLGRIALIGETAADVRDVMIEGVSGLLSVHGKRDRPRWESSRKRLLWDSGAVAQAFSAEDPESLRGPQFHAAWCDELAKWRYARETWDMLQFGLRLGDWPRQLVTTTPRPTPLLKELIAHPATALTRALTRENAANLAPSFLESVIAQYAGTRLGRQELDGEIIEERKDALPPRLQRRPSGGARRGTRQRMDAHRRRAVSHARRTARGRGLPACAEGRALREMGAAPARVRRPARQRRAAAAAWRADFSLLRSLARRKTSPSLRAAPGARRRQRIPRRAWGAAGPATHRSGRCSRPSAAAAAAVADLASHRAAAAALRG